MGSRPSVWISSLLILVWLVVGLCVDSSQTLVVSVQLRPDQGLLGDMLRREVANAKRLERTPVVELISASCPACSAIQSVQGDPRMLDAFSGVYLIQLDTDLWRNHLRPRGFDPRLVPRFYLVDADGNPTGLTIARDAWGEDVPEQMAPALEAYFQSNRKKK